MAKSKYIIGNKYSPRQLMELAVEEMSKSVPDPNRADKTNPKVGAVLTTSEGILLCVSHRGELRVGDHAEFTLLERHNRATKMDTYVLYATLEPCAPGARNHPKLSCAERITNARIAKVFIGAIDPDPTVAGQGRDFLIANKTEVAYFDQDLQEDIFNANKEFFEEAEIKAKEYKPKSVLTTETIFTKHLQNYSLKDLSDNAQEDLIARMGLAPKGSVDYYEYLEKLGLFFKTNTKELFKPTGLGLLLFGKNPQIEFPQARIKFTIEQAEGEAKIKDIEGPLLLMPDKIEDLLELTFLPEINRTSFHREEIAIISKVLLRELIINALVHRNYDLGNMQIRIIASANKLEIWSPGVPIVPLEKFKSFEVPSISRNPKLAYIFFKAGLVEERGIGMKELKAFRDSNDLKTPEFRMNEDYFIITIFRDRSKLNNLKVEITEEQKAVYDFITFKKEVSKSDIVKQFDIDEKKAQRILSKLRELNLLLPQGKGPSTKYILNKSES